MPHPGPPLPLKPPTDPPRANPAPAWVALLAAWVGLLMLIASVVFVFLPGSINPREELEHQIQYSPADRFLPVPIYGITFGLFLGIVALWQMRHQRRPLPEALVNQRIQAWVGILLCLLAAAVIYIYVGLYGPTANRS